MALIPPVPMAGIASLPVAVSRMGTDQPQECSEAGMEGEFREVNPSSSCCITLKYLRAFIAAAVLRPID